MNKLFLLIFFIVVILGCNKQTGDLIPDAPEEPPKDELFKLKSIAFLSSEDERSETFTVPRKSLDFSNGTSVRQLVVINPNEDLNETSIFQSGELKQYDVLDTTGIAVPLHIDENGNISLGESKWPFSETLAEMPTALDLKDSIYVEPNKKLHISLSVNMIKYRSSYKAVLVDEASGKEVEITGVWTGVYPVNANVEYQSENL